MKFFLIAGLLLSSMSALGQTASTYLDESSSSSSTEKASIKVVISGYCKASFTLEPSSLTLDIRGYPTGANPAYTDMNFQLQALIPGENSSNIRSSFRDISLSAKKGLFKTSGKAVSTNINRNQLFRHTDFKNASCKDGSNLETFRNQLRAIGDTNAIGQASLTISGKGYPLSYKLTQKNSFEIIGPPKCEVSGEVTAGLGNLSNETFQAKCTKRDTVKVSISTSAKGTTELAL